MTIVTPLLLVAVVLGLLLPMSLKSPLIAVGALGLVGLTAYIAALGAERSSRHLLVLAFFFAPLTNLAAGPKPFVLASFLFFLSFVLVLPRLVHRALHLPKLFLGGGLLFTIMGLVAAPFAINSLVSLWYLVTAVIALIGIPAVMVWMNPSDRQMYAMMLAFAFGAAFSTLYGLPGYTYRNYGFTYHPVALAYTCMLALSFVPYLMASKHARSRWLFVPPLAAIALVGVWTSGSRTGLVVLFALALLVPLLERSIKLGLALIAGVVLILPSILSLDPSRGSTSALARLFGSGGAQNSDTTRLSTIRDGLEQVQQSPIVGNGYSVEHTYVIHNLYLQVLAAEGVLGLVGLLLLLSGFVAALRKASSPRRALAYPALAVILAGPFQPNMADHYLGMSLGLSLVAVVGIMRGSPPSDEDAPSAGSGIGIDTQAKV